MANIIERWGLIKLENLLDFYIGGDWGEQEPINSNYTATKVLRATDISNWENDHGENAQVRYLKDNSLAKRQLKENDLIIEVSGGSPDQPVGRTIIISSNDIQKFQYPVTCSNFFRLLRFNNKINSKFINYYFNFLYETKIIELYQSNSTNLRNLKFSQFLNQNIPVPQTLGEQQEIVDVLDAADRIIRLRKECIKSAQDLIPALFQEMFGDINNNIHSLPISEIKSCVEINPTKIVMNDNDDVTFLGMKDVTENGQIDLSTIKKYKEVKKGFTSFKNDDVLLAKITPCFENGKAAIAKNLVNNTGFGSTEFYVLRPNQNKILPEYLYSIVKSSRFSEIGRSNMKGAAGQKRLIKDFVSNYKFLLPDIPQQKSYAAKVQEIEAYIKAQQAELENAKTMFQSLLHHSFTGELTRRAYGE